MSFDRATTLSTDQIAWIPGQVLSSFATISGVSGETETEIPFGAAVRRTAENTFRLVTDTGHRIFGVVAHSATYFTDGDDATLGATGIKPGAPLTVVQEGAVVVTAENTTAVEGAAYSRLEDGDGGDTPGHWRATNTDTDTAVLAAGARWGSLRRNGCAVLTFNFRGAQ